MMNKGMDLAAVQLSLCTQVTDVTESKVTDCQTSINIGELICDSL